MYENRGVLAVLVGSGISRSAEIPTGWDMTLDLIRRVALAKGAVEQVDWADWYRKETGEEPNYSTLLEELGASPEERRAVLHRYIEPTEDEFQAGKKVPTAAHRALAQLVRKGYIRVIVTTNFDRLIENALRDCGVEPTVVASLDSMKGAEPIAHSNCYILKIHGDYKDARILNTDAELSTYPVEYDRLLDRILDEYGLVVCGWSGEWDHALRSAFLRSPNRRYPMFWATRGRLGDGAKELIKHRDGREISISDGDAFFNTLLQRIETLEQSQQVNPMSIEMLVNNTKRLLAKSEYRIQLDDLLTHETSRVIDSLGSSDLDPNVTWSVAEFRNRVTKVEATAESLACMVGNLGRWGAGDEISLVIDIVRNLYTTTTNSGNNIFINLKTYPAVLIFTAYSLGLVRAERWKNLLEFFNATIEHDHREPRRLIETVFIHVWKGAENDVWKNIEGFDRRKTPFSDHLESLFSTWGKRFVGLVPDFEVLFERFELLGSFAHLQREEKSTLQSGLNGDAWGRNWVWMPVGRVGWHSQNGSKLIKELQTEPMKARLLNAGFAQGDSEFFDLSIRNFERAADRMQWS